MAEYIERERTSRKLTLNDAVNMIYPDDADLTVFVFEDEEDRDSFRSGKQNESYLFSFRSQYVCNFFLKERFANAEVIAIYLVSKDTVDLVINAGADNG